MKTLKFTSMQYGLFVAGVLLMVVLLWPSKTPIPEGVTRESALADARACAAAADTALIFYDNCSFLQDFDPDQVADAQPQCRAQFEQLRAFSSDRVRGEMDREAAVSGAVTDVQRARADLSAQVARETQSGDIDPDDVWCSLYDETALENSPLGAAIRGMAGRLNP
ncbi:hypothetical protein [Octadecabacter sp. R77987]|uniref:hypothetical protein n=1 Tax=Octadecabacter sp. R77987 TaxID=3093874 RepID=UPI00366B09D4